MNKERHNNLSTILGAALLVAGMSIGGSTVSIHTVAQSFGFSMTLVLFLGASVLMLVTALMLAKVCCRHPNCKSFFSLIATILGPNIRNISLLLLMLLFYTLMGFYVHVLHDMLGIISYAIISLLMIGLLIGTYMIDWINRGVMYLLLISFALLMVTLLSIFDVGHLWYSGKALTFDSSIIFIIIAAFGFQIIVPSISDYLKYDFRSLAIALVIGAVFILLVYSIYTTILIGNLSMDYLVKVTDNPSSLTHLIQEQNPNSYHWLRSMPIVFYLAAVVSSFIGVSKSLYDVLQDAIPVSNQYKGFLVISIIAIPALILGHVFLSALALLKLAGLFVIILNIILPAVLSLQSIKLNQAPSILQWCVHIGIIGLAIILMIQFFVPIF
ncbi:MAG: aromatic amino acid transport family protein [Candidatus Comchoanobacterales bacterium]